MNAAYVGATAPHARGALILMHAISTSTQPLPTMTCAHMEASDYQRSFCLTAALLGGILTTKCCCVGCSGILTVGATASTVTIATAFAVAMMSLTNAEFAVLTVLAATLTFVQMAAWTVPAPA